MLSLESSCAPDVLTDALADLLAVLHPEAGMGSRSAVLEFARRSLRRFLRRLRHHFHESAILHGALQKAEPACGEALRWTAAVHDQIRRLSHEISARVRSEEIRRARFIARKLMALIFEHLAEERQLLTRILCSLNSAATGRFADALFDRMMDEMAARRSEAPSRQSVADLHALYVRLIRDLQGRPVDPKSSEMEHEHSRP